MKVKLTTACIEFNDTALEAINLKMIGEEGKANRETVDAFIENSATHALDIALSVFYMTRAKKLKEEAAKYDAMVASPAVDAPEEDS